MNLDEMIVVEMTADKMSINEVNGEQTLQMK